MCLRLKMRAQTLSAQAEHVQAEEVHVHSFIHSFIHDTPSNPQITDAGALQQTFYGSPAACPVLGSPPQCNWKVCKLQVFPDIVHPLLLIPAPHS